MSKYITLILGVLFLAFAISRCEVGHAATYTWPMGDKIEDKEYFIHLITMLETTGYNDTIILSYDIYNQGGDGYLADEINLAIVSSKAYVIARLHAPIASAAAHIACYADELQGLSKDNYLMFHTVQSITPGGEVNTDPNHPVARRHRAEQNISYQECVAKRILTKEQVDNITNTLYYEVYVDSFKLFGISE